MSEFVVLQEPDTVAVRPIATTAVASVLIGALGVFFAGVLLTATTGALRPDVGGRLGKKAGGPILSEVEQTPVEVERRGIDLKAGQRRELETWGWVDRHAKIAKIPVDRAIDVIVAGGAP
jgi:hypothetical protein